MLITESMLRTRWHKNKKNIINLEKDCIFTPAARDFLREKGIKVELAGEGLADLTLTTLTSATAPTGETGKKQATAAITAETISNSLSSAQKPEHMTHLNSQELVSKTHPVIFLRGQLDLFACALVQTQIKFAQLGQIQLCDKLGEIAKFSRKLMLAEVQNKPLDFGILLGYSEIEVRQISHNPQLYFGTPHKPLDYKDGLVTASLHFLRAKVREVELYANKAFAGKDGKCERPDIILALNRLSSLFYILAVNESGVGKEPKHLPIGVSNRHIHLSKEHLTKLFGNGYVLQKNKDLSQPGQFAAQETVVIAGPKGEIQNVRILGPLRTETQVEISTTDAFKLGIKPVLKNSGDLEGTSRLKISGAKGSVEIKQGALVAARHIHLEPELAKKWGLQDKERVSVKIKSARPITFHDVLVRVSPEFKGELHLDTDEANAALVQNDTLAELLI